MKAGWTAPQVRFSSRSFIDAYSKDRAKGVEALLHIEKQGKLMNAEPLKKEEG